MHLTGCLAKHGQSLLEDRKLDCGSHCCYGLVFCQRTELHHINLIRMTKSRLELGELGSGLDALQALTSTKLLACSTLHLSERRPIIVSGAGHASQRFCE